MNEDLFIKDIHIFLFDDQGLFEQVLAAVDFNLFYPLMAKRNIMIQEQVLAMIIASTGILPESLSKSSQMRADVEVHPTRAAIIISSSGGDRHEEELLKQVIRYQIVILGQ